jgi:hypothetical protein
MPGVNLGHLEDVFLSVILGARASCPARIRTWIDRSKVCCPTVRRPGKKSGKMSEGRDLNPRPSRWQRDVLPLNYPRDWLLVPREGFEPSRSFGAQDFKSCLSADSNTAA